MAFDPDKYLSTSTDFNPDKYLGEFNPDTYLGTSPPPEEAGLLSPTTYKVAGAELVNAADKTWSSLGSLMHTDNTDKQDEIFGKMEKRVKARSEWANPDNQKISIPGQIAGAVATFPFAGLQIPSVGMDLIDKGESLSTAAKGAAITAAAIPIQAIPLVGSQFGKYGSKVVANMVVGGAQQAASDAAISTIVEGQAAKEAYAPTWEKTIVSGGAAGVAHVATRSVGIVKEKQRAAKVDALRNLALEKQADAVALQVKIDEQKKTIEQLRLSQELANREEFVQPIDDPAKVDQSKQLELPLEVSAQSIAEMQGVESGQRDLFAPDNHNRSTGETRPMEVDQMALFDERIKAEEEKYNKLQEQQQAQLVFDITSILNEKSKAPEQQAQLVSDITNILNEKSKAPVEEAVTKEELSRATEEAQRRIDRAWMNREAAKSVEGSRLWGENFPGARKIPKGQLGAVNMDIFEDGFFKIKIRPDGLTQTAESVDGGLEVKLWDKKGKEISRVGFISTDIMPSPKSDLYASWVSTDPEVRGNNYAKSLYEWTSELGNDIVESHNKLRDGERMWEKFEKSGFAKYDSVNQKRFIPQAQRGGIDLQAIAEGLRKLKEPIKLGPPIHDIPGIKARDIQPDPLASDTIKKALTETPKDPNISFSAGTDLESAKTGSTVIKDVGTIVKNFGKRSERWVRDHVYPVENAFRKFSANEYTNLHTLWKLEQEMGSLLTPEDMIKSGFSKKEVEAHIGMRESMKAALDITNEMRASRGMAPISAREGAFARMWKGDFSTIIKDKDGNVVYKLSAGNQYTLGRQTAKLLKKFPDLKAEKIETYAEGNPSSSYSLMLDILGREGKTKEITDYVEEAGVRGFLGDREGIVNSLANAKDHFAAQISYMKEASRLAEITKASENLKAIMTNEELIAKQPKQMAYVKQHVENALGFGTSDGMRMVEKGFGKLFGISPSSVGQLIGNTKGVWVTSKLMFSLGYTVSNGFQMFNTAPHIMDLHAQGYHGNPITTATYGMLGGSFLGLGHIGTKGDFSKHIDTIGKNMPEVIREAMHYAENNSVTNRSVYDETPIGKSNNSAWQAAKMSVTAPETLARSVVFMSLVGHLHSSGKFTKAQWGEMFQMAETRTNMAMSDARQTERAQIFSRGGVIGSGFNILQTYPMNWFNNLSLFTREAAKGNPAPLFTMLAVQGTVAGTMGMPLVQDLHHFWEYIKRHWLPSSVWVKVKDWNLNQFLITHGGGETAAYGPVSTKSGYNFTSRLNSPQITGSATIPGGAAIDMWKTITDVGDAVAHITDEAKRAQALLSLSGPGTKDFIAQTLLANQTQTKPDKQGRVGVFSRSNIENRTSMYRRTPEEQSKAKLGIRTQKEAFLSDAEYPLRSMDAEMMVRRQAVASKIYRDMKTSKIDKADTQLYVALGGKDLQAVLKSKTEKEFLTNLERTGQRAGRSAAAAAQYKRVLEMIEKAGYAN